MVQPSYLYMTTGKKKKQQHSFDSTDFAVVTGLEKTSFHSSSKKDNANECSNYRTIVLISHASKGPLKILQSRLQQYVNWEFPRFKVGPKSVDKYPYKGKEREIRDSETQRKRPGKDRGKDWSAATSQATPRTVCNHQTLGDRHRVNSPSECPQGTNPPDTWISGFRPL